MTIVRIKRHFQITLPASLRKKLNLEEGDFMEAVIKDNTIVLRPQKLIDSNQAWFWSKRWKKRQIRISRLEE